MTANSWQASLWEVQKAYFIGLQKKPAPLTADPFQPVLTAILQKRWSVQQWELAEQAREICERGLSAARKGDLVTSARAFQEAEAFLAAGQFSREALLISQSLYEAAAAYLDYRNAQFEHALKRLHSAIALDLTLEQIPGYALIVVHRIRLLLNMLRILVKLSATQEAMQIGAQIMNYLENKAALPSLPSSAASSLLEIPQELKDLQFTEATGGIAALLAGVDSLETGQPIGQHFTNFACHIHFPDAHACHLSPQTHAWLRAKQALIDEQPENFLRQASQLLSQGRAALPQIWYATIVDLLSICQRSDLAEARMIKKEILAAAPSWPWKQFPASWQALLHLPSERQGSMHFPGTKRAEYAALEQQSASLAVSSKAI